MEGTSVETPRRSIGIGGGTKYLRGKTKNKHLEKNHVHKMSSKRFNLKGTHGHCQGHFCGTASDWNSRHSPLSTTHFQSDTFQVVSVEKYSYN